MRQINHSSIRRCVRIERRSDGRLFLGNVEIVPAYDRPWRSQALAGSTLDALTMNYSDSAACVRFGGARLHRCQPMRRAGSRTGQRADMLGRLPRQAAAKASALRLADIAFVRAMRWADDRDAINPHVLLKCMSAGRLSGARMTWLLSIITGVAVIAMQAAFLIALHFILH